MVVAVVAVVAGGVMVLLGFFCLCLFFCVNRCCRCDAQRRNGNPASHLLQGEVCRTQYKKVGFKS